MQHFSKKAVLDTLNDTASGSWVIKSQVLSQYECYSTPFGTLKYINLKGWCFENFSGYKSIPAQSTYSLIDFLEHEKRDYMFTCEPIQNYLLGKTTSL